MHSFHQSRGRILFEGLCALGISASLAGAWLQTEASDLLPAASLVLVYGLVRLSDMTARKPMKDAVSQEERAPAVETVEEPKPAVKPKASRPKAARKGGPREAKPPKEAPAAEPALIEEPTTAELPIADPVAEEMTPIPLEPLFEPQPFVRQQHAVFGRKSRFG